MFPAHTMRNRIFWGDSGRFLSFLSLSPRSFFFFFWTLKAKKKKNYIYKTSPETLKRHYTHAMKTVANCGGFKKKKKEKRKTENNIRIYFPPCSSCHCFIPSWINTVHSFFLTALSRECCPELKNVAAAFFFSPLSIRLPFPIQMAAQ